MIIWSSTRSLIYVTLQNGNTCASISIGLYTKLKGENQNMKMVLQKISYLGQKWSICIDLNFLLS